MSLACLRRNPQVLASWQSMEGGGAFAALEDLVAIPLARLGAEDVVANHVQSVHLAVPKDDFDCAVYERAKSRVLVQRYRRYKQSGNQRVISLFAEAVGVRKSSRVHELSEILRRFRPPEAHLEDAPEAMVGALGRQVL
eukprot:CAMPEP_0180349282 /NCGR_PEP_ID=MMETSP0989-20121125/5381_1 /TAXON_ID=697907 /ORGANISM="non described non described, Strain CCMP2293" /LENGTH=138 /DNA_ID=CAMNT_0022338585 /DNA_START=105 /DNA_END=522 /DNA_ORIENTATION=-